MTAPPLAHHGSGGRFQECYAARLVQTSMAETVTERTIDPEAGHYRK